MPKKINVVSLSDIKPAEEDSVEIKNDNDERNQITEAIKEEEALNPTPANDEVSPMSIDTQEAKPKPKRKAAPKKTKVVEEVAPIPEPVVESIPEPTPEPQKKVKTLELVKCDKCNKEMTKRTLRYDHPKNCKGAPINREEMPVQKRTKPASPPKVVQELPVIPNDIIEQEVKKRIQNSIQDRLHMKLKQKEERIKKLAEKIA